MNIIKVSSGIGSRKLGILTYTYTTPVSTVCQLLIACCQFLLLVDSYYLLLELAVHCQLPVSPRLSLSVQNKVRYRQYL